MEGFLNSQGRESVLKNEKWEDSEEGLSFL